MTQQQALHFAHEWIDAFNAHDLDAIMVHYANELEFYSPLIPLLTLNETGLITNKGDLKRYFQVGLSIYPNLHFTLHHVFVGMHTLVLCYTSVNGRLASEVFYLNEWGQAQKVFCHYTLDNSRVALPE